MGALAQKACNGVIEVGAAPAAVAELRTWGYVETAAENDFSTMGACEATIVGGRVTSRLEMTLYLADPADVAQDELIAGAEDVAVVVYPFGLGVGLVQRAGNINVLERGEAGDVDGGVELTVSATSPAGLASSIQT